MKHLGPALIVLIIGWMLNAMAATQAYGQRRTAEIEYTEDSERTVYADEEGVPPQNDSNGVDEQYEHGTWCVDGRTF